MPNMYRDSEVTTVTQPSNELTRKLKDLKKGGFFLLLGGATIAFAELALVIMLIVLVSIWAIWDTIVMIGGFCILSTGRKCIVCVERLPLISPSQIACWSTISGVFAVATLIFGLYQVIFLSIHAGNLEWYSDPTRVVSLTSLSFTILGSLLSIFGSFIATTSSNAVKRLVSPTIFITAESISPGTMYGHRQQTTLQGAAYPPPAFTGELQYGWSSEGFAPPANEYWSNFTNDALTPNTKVDEGNKDLPPKYADIFGQADQ